MPCALTPAYGLASMPFHPGCHRPFHPFQSSVALLLRLSWASVSLHLTFFVSYFTLRLYCKPIVIVLSNVITPSVITLRPFTPCLNSWCILRGLLLHPAALVVLQVFTPDGVLWKVRESNPLLILSILMSPYRGIIGRWVSYSICLFAPTIQAFPFLLFFFCQRVADFPQRNPTSLLPSASGTCPPIFPH